MNVTADHSCQLPVSVRPVRPRCRHVHQLFPVPVPVRSSCPDESDDVIFHHQQRRERRYGHGRQQQQQLAAISVVDMSAELTRVLNDTAVDPSLPRHGRADPEKVKVVECGTGGVDYSKRRRRRREVIQCVDAGERRRHLGDDLDDVTMELMTPKWTLMTSQ